MVHVRIEAWGVYGMGMGEKEEREGRSGGEG